MPCVKHIPITNVRLKEVLELFKNLTNFSYAFDSCMRVSHSCLMFEIINASEFSVALQYTYCIKCG